MAVRFEGNKMCVKLDGKIPTLNIMDKFHTKGCEQMIIENTGCLTGKDGKAFYYNLVIEHANGQDYAGEITMTKLKTGQDEELRNYIKSQIGNEEIKKYKKTGHVCYFKKPYLLRAQKSEDHSGFGWEFNWHGNKKEGGLVKKGKFYGETREYRIAGVLIG